MSATTPTELTLDSWLAATIENLARRAAVRATVDGLDDFRACALEDLEAVCGLASWPALTRRRFVEAWKRLNAAPALAPVVDYQPRAPKVRNCSIVGPSLGPRDARGNFPCPTGCPRNFAHAPAAVQHGKSCTAVPVAVSTSQNSPTAPVSMTIVARTGPPAARRSRRSPARRSSAAWTTRAPSS